MAGEDILTMFTVIEGLIKSEISSVRDEINALNNYLNNASFAADMQYWTGSSNIRIFRVDGCCISTVTSMRTRNLSLI